VRVCVLGISNFYIRCSSSTSRLLFLACSRSSLFSPCSFVFVLFRFFICFFLGLSVRARFYGPYPVNRFVRGLAGNAGWLVPEVRSGILLHTGEWANYSSNAPWGFVQLFLYLTTRFLANTFLVLSSSRPLFLPLFRFLVPSPPRSVLYFSVAHCRRCCSRGPHHLSFTGMASSPIRMAGRVPLRFGAARCPNYCFNVPQSLLQCAARVCCPWLGLLIVGYC
jgi:hypothetical protein